jgi:hypothetical protein
VLEWAEVAFAAHSHDKISPSSDFGDPIVDTTTAAASFSSTELSF